MISVESMRIGVTKIASVVVTMGIIGPRNIMSVGNPYSSPSNPAEERVSKKKTLSSL